MICRQVWVWKTWRAILSSKMLISRRYTRFRALFWTLLPIWSENSRWLTTGTTQTKKICSMEWNTRRNRPTSLSKLTRSGSKIASSPSKRLNAKKASRTPPLCPTWSKRPSATFTRTRFQTLNLIPPRLLLPKREAELLLYLKRGGIKELRLKRKIKITMTNLQTIALSQIMKAECTGLLLACQDWRSKTQRLFF